MRQKNFDNNVVNITIFIISMCFMGIFGVQKEHQQQQHNFSFDENSSMSATGKAFEANNNGKSNDATWQPMSQDNWIILKTAARKVGKETASPSATPIASLIMPANNQRDSYRNRNSQRFRYQYWHKKQQAYPVTSHLLPTHYYNYNQNITGNYQQPRRRTTDVKLIEPYVVTISQMRALTDSSLPNTDSIITRRIGNENSKLAFSAPLPYTGGMKLPKDMVINVVAPTSNIEFRQYGEDKYNNTQENFAAGFDNTIEASDEHFNANDVTIARDIDSSVNNSHFENIPDDQMKNGGALVNGILQLFRNTLDKIISFCDMTRRFLSDGDANGDGDEGNDGIEAPTASIKDKNDDSPFINKKPTTMPTIKEVQGHHGLSIKTPKPSTNLTRSTQVQSRTLTALSATGTGRKRLKKKLRKFILPLLLAYKLKFLTLIPVLIGGLTLLVGTTGLAGFFFALFTAVMSLKAAGRSIIVKKI